MVICNDDFADVTTATNGGKSSLDGIEPKRRDGADWVYMASVDQNE